MLYPATKQFVSLLSAVVRPPLRSSDPLRMRHWQQPGPTRTRTWNHHCMMKIFQKMTAVRTAVERMFKLLFLVLSRSSDSSLDCTPGRPGSGFRAVMMMSRTRTRRPWPVIRCRLGGYPPP